MSDITKCTNEQCLIKDGCKRWLTQAHEVWQSYCRFEPKSLIECDYYWPDNSLTITIASSDQGGSEKV